MSGSDTQTRPRGGSAPLPLRDSDKPTIGRKRGGSFSKATVEQTKWVKDVLKVDIQPPPIQVQPQPIDPIPPPPPPPPRPPQLQQAIAARLMTFEELAQKIGHQPHQDKTFKNPITKKTVTVKKMSTAYKKIQAELNETASAISETGNIKLDDFDAEKRKEVEATLKAQLKDLRDAALAYKQNHRRNDTKSGAADEFIKSIDDYEAMLKTGLDAILEDPSFDLVKDHLNLEQALYAKQCGINFADCRFDEYNDDEADEIDDKFGSGVANSVSKIKYGDGQTLVFKKERASETYVEQLPIARAIGIDNKSVHNGNRNIATSSVADLLGVSVIPNVCYGLHKNTETGENEIGLLMTLAPGTTPNKKDKTTGLVQRRKLWTDDNKPSPVAQAKLVQQLNALDWCDVITGQQDRHGLNYLVDINGDDVTVTGIDNDVAFGSNQKDASCSKMNYSSRTTPPGLPPLIDKPTYDHIVASDFDRDLKPKLQSLLTAEELEAAKSRFDQAKLHAQGLHPHYIVTDWQTWRSPPPDNLNSKQFLKQAGNGVGATSSGGLFGRDFAATFEKDGIL